MPDGATATAPTQDILDDPDFQSLNLQDKHKALLATKPEYAALPPKNQADALNEIHYGAAPKVPSNNERQANEFLLGAASGASGLKETQNPISDTASALASANDVNTVGLPKTARGAPSSDYKPGPVSSYLGPLGGLLETGKSLFAPAREGEDPEDVAERRVHAAGTITGMAGTGMIGEGVARAPEVAARVGEVRGNIGNAIHEPETGDFTPAAQRKSELVGAGVGTVAGGGAGLMGGHPVYGAMSGGAIGHRLAPGLMETMFPESAERVAGRTAYKSAKELTEANEGAIAEDASRTRKSALDAQNPGRTAQGPFSRLSNRLPKPQQEPEFQNPYAIRAAGPEIPRKGLPVAEPGPYDVRAAGPEIPKEGLPQPEPGPYDIRAAGPDTPTESQLDIARTPPRDESLTGRPISGPEIPRGGVPAPEPGPYDIRAAGPEIPKEGLPIGSPITVAETPEPSVPSSRKAPVLESEGRPATWTNEKVKELASWGDPDAIEQARNRGFGRIPQRFSATQLNPREVVKFDENGAPVNEGRQSIGTPIAEEFEQHTPEDMAGRSSFVRTPEAPAGAGRGPAPMEMHPEELAEIRKLTGRPNLTPEEAHAYRIAQTARAAAERKPNGDLGGFKRAGE